MNIFMIQMFFQQFSNEDSFQFNLKFQINTSTSVWMLWFLQDLTIVDIHCPDGGHSELWLNEPKSLHSRLNLDFWHP
jgi:hypothetical protein